MSERFVKDEIATVARDITFPAFAGVLRIQDETLLTRGGGKGVRLYDEIERDCHVYSVLQKRKSAVIARGWSVVAASKSKKDKYAADLVRDQINNMGCPILDGLDATVPVASNFDRISYNLLDAILKGYSVGEVMWGRVDNQIVAQEIRARNQFRFTFDDKYCLRLRTPENLMEGIPLPGRKFVVHTFDSKDGNPLGLGLGSRLFWPAFFKRNGIVFWLSFLERFGSPLIVGKYPAGSDPKVKADVLAAIAAISQEAGAAIPDNTMLQFLESARSGTITHEQFMKFMDDQISEAVLGETMTTSNRGGAGLNSGGHAEVQNEVRLELVKADADLLSGTLNATVIAWISLFNVPGATPPKVWRLIEEAKDLGAQATRDKTIFSMGFRPTLNYIQDTYGGEWTDIGVVPPTSGNQDTPIPKSSASPDATAAFSDPSNPTPPQAMSTTMSQAAQDPWQAVIAHLGKLVAKAKSMSDLKQSIEDAYSALSLEDLRSVQSMGYAAAQLAGLSEVESGD